MKYSYSKKPKESIPRLFLHDGKVFNELGGITEGFNTFFVNIVSELASAIPNSDTSFSSFLGDHFNVNFIFANITTQKVYEILNQLKSKKSSGIDNISTKLLKEIMPFMEHDHLVSTHLLSASLAIPSLAIQTFAFKLIYYQLSCDHIHLLSSLNCYRHICYQIFDLLSILILTNFFP